MSKGVIGRKSVRYLDNKLRRCSLKRKKKGCATVPSSESVCCRNGMLMHRETTFVKKKLSQPANNWIVLYCYKIQRDPVCDDD